MSGTRALGAAPNEGLSLQATLLVSILIRYPEISSVRFTGPHGRITFSFMLNQPQSNSRLARFRRLARSHFQAYAEITRRRAGYFRVRTTTYESCTVVQMIRDVATFSREELSLVVGVLRSFFQHDLLVEVGEPLGEDEQALQEDVIDGALQELNPAGLGRELVGFREAGRVMVFNRNPHGVAKTQE